MSIEVRSVTGYRRRFPASDAGRLWLVTRLEGQPLEPGQGAPVRMVAPGRLGFWWVKWVSSVELSDRPSASTSAGDSAKKTSGSTRPLQSPFPLQ